MSLKAPPKGRNQQAACVEPSSRYFYSQPALGAVYHQRQQLTACWCLLALQLCLLTQQEGKGTEPNQATLAQVTSEIPRDSEQVLLKGFPASFLREKHSQDRVSDGHSPPEATCPDLNPYLHAQPFTEFIPSPWVLPLLLQYPMGLYGYFPTPSSAFSLPTGEAGYVLDKMQSSQL